jgi:hypothetical protein
LTQSCNHCHAVHEDGADCESCFHALLAYENERPAAFGAVHHITVSTYYLQHPAGYRPEVLDHWREVIRKALAGATIRELREFSGKAFEGSKPVREPGATPPGWWPSSWPLTIQSVFVPDAIPDVDDYVDRARQWARATLDALDAAEASSDAPRRTARR